MAIEFILVVAALVLAILSLVNSRYPWLVAAVICLAIAALI